MFTHKNTLSTDTRKIPCRTKVSTFRPEILLNIRTESSQSRTVTGPLTGGKRHVMGGIFNLQGII